MTKTLVVAFSSLAVTAVMLSGCRVEKTTHGDSKDVNISTPFGGLNVKTNDADVIANIGLPAYPGAQPVKNDNDHGSADVNMSFGSFQLRVKAASFRSDDSPDKVEAFYRSGLKRFGDVIACRDDKVIGSPVRTVEGLTCDNQKEGHIMVQDDPNKHKLELKAGSGQHQHIVEIDPDGGGTKFGLVVLDLPGKISGDEGDDTRQ
jgi:hypothetical protein